MSRQSPFFKFDAMQWLGGSIQFCTLEEKGLFIDICAMYWESQKPVIIDTKFKVRYRYVEGALPEIVRRLTDLQILEESEAGLTVPFLDLLIQERKEWSQKCSEWGKKSAKSKGRSTKKKEERRKKKEDSRENIDIKSRDDSFCQSAKPIGLSLGMPQQMIDDFTDYWTEPDKVGKMRFEKQKTWDTRRRMQRWQRNNFNDASRTTVDNREDRNYGLLD